MYLVCELEVPVELLLLLGVGQRDSQEGERERRPQDSHGRGVGCFGRSETKDDVHPPRTTASVCSRQSMRPAHATEPPLHFPFPFPFSFLFPIPHSPFPVPFVRNRTRQTRVANCFEDFNSIRKFMSHFSHAVNQF